MEMYLHAFPDFHLEIEQILASDDYVIARWHAIGTHRGELMALRQPIGRNPKLVEQAW